MMKQQPFALRLLISKGKRASKIDRLLFAEILKADAQVSGKKA